MALNGLKTLERFFKIGRYELTDQQLASLNIAMIQAVVDKLSERTWITKNFPILENLAIRDTDNHNSELQVDLYQADNYSFYINNACNQVLTFRILGGLTQGAAAAPIGDPLTVPANSLDCVSVDIQKLWQPWIGARASFETAPTTGQVNVIMCRRERSWGQ